MTPLNFIQNFFQFSADNRNLVFAEVVIKRQGDCPAADRFGNGIIPFSAAESLGNKWLQMNGRKVIADLDTLLSHRLENFIALLQPESLCKPNNKDKPTHLTASLLSRYYQSLIAGQHLLVPFRHLSAFGLDLVDSRELNNSEGAIDVA